MKYLVFALMVLFSIVSCRTTPPQPAHTFHMQTNESNSTEYRASRTRVFDLIHTDLKVSFNWNKRYLYGEASLILTPHQYAQKELKLDARGMLIHNLKILSLDDSIAADYIYKDDVITIQLDKEYKKGDSVNVYIKYTARPEEIPTGGSVSITSDKGLYFINPDGKEAHKPKMIWTQGETQASSAWFPTIDAPNQKTTQRISITVDTVYTTLSNGLKINAIYNADGTRTDIWEQKLPHAPYLVMMVVGVFDVIKSSWKNKEVSYYVEPEYRKPSEKLFRETPEMIDFFSRITGIPYPWDKYAQVVARDYVSGSMENTSATLHGDFMRMDEREMIDFDSDEYISHELFHQWFGDLVTCESWSNLPLNESFASYGEYLWEEYRYGKAMADYHIYNDLQQYLGESRTKMVDMIRFNYNEREDMFDRHSYEKGACILHMLRNYTGDDAFFSALKLYLQRNQFKSVEMHDLRLAFEEVTGEDLNWFFNQWFFDKGHPELDITYTYTEADQLLKVKVKQVQDLKETPLYKIPTSIEIHHEAKRERKSITIQKTEELFEFKCDRKPLFVNFDADKTLLCVKNDRHSDEEWEYLYSNSSLFKDKLEALERLSDDFIIPSTRWKTIKTALNDSLPPIRAFAVSKVARAAQSPDSLLIWNKLVNILMNDNSSAVRQAALTSLLIGFKYTDPSDVLLKAINDSSYIISGTALIIYTNIHKDEGLKMARAMKDPANKPLNQTLLNLFSRFGDERDASYMLDVVSRVEGFDQYEALQMYSLYIQQIKDDNKVADGIDYIYKVASGDNIWFIRTAAIQALYEIKANFKQNEALAGKIDAYLQQVKSTEKDQRVLQLIK